MDKYQRALLENSSNGSNERFFSCTPIKKCILSIDCKLEDLNFKKEILDMLRMDRKHTVRDLAKYTEEGLLKLNHNVANKYSADVLQELTNAGIGSNFLESDFDYDTDIYKLVQDADIFSTKYCFTLKSNTNIETCTICTNGNWVTVEQVEESFSIMLDFENRVEKVKLTFADNIVDDYIFSVQYVEADKDLYYQKQGADRKANLLAAAQIKHSTSSDLINIYFQPCCDKYEYTEILLYIPQEENFKGWTGDGGKVVEILSWSMIKKCKVSPEDFYKSINGLAPGTYSYVIKQYDKKDELLMETEHIEFQIKKPQRPLW